MTPKHNNRTLIGITGSIGSGKSTVLAMFGELGAETISSDAIARTFTEPTSPVIGELVQIFGNSILDTNGAPIRAKIAELAFSDKTKLQALNDLLHPLVRKTFLEFLNSRKDGSIVAWEVPLLFETDAHTICDFTVTVAVSPEVAWERVQNRGGMDYEDFQKRNLSQMDLEKKKSLSDFVVTNDNQRENLKEQIAIINSEIKKRIKK
ncbi:dephospho-CoA kinase [Leptospira meyeri]|uniref:Dephospho-CoA kinase n=1 Tax=Leptospira meyeri TaxID=29508 RepID=A0A4R8MR07_LEPME|nr:dephospho-CoA kinase [Leptospira meyeri]EKJ85361.1 dephospho-CoA kinase [Leptospira meyeri serovar Hardjo str. Went 5]TDY71799.1 dephospho-CoA kinase [Leptospira meyeri]TGL47898.1 dephospho-CoA kinase [Leptospira meyeri]